MKTLFMVLTICTTNTLLPICNESHLKIPHTDIEKCQEGGLTIIALANMNLIKDDLQATKYNCQFEDEDADHFTKPTMRGR